LSISALGKTLLLKIRRATQRAICQTPNTATGKLSKYPFTLRFNCQKGKITFTGSIDYLSNNSIGKISITIFDIKDTTQINIAVKDGQLRIIKIEHSDKKTYMQTLYNYNSK
jgi:hypothetical protein